jgi:hypothetical protein
MRPILADQLAYLIRPIRPIRVLSGMKGEGIPFISDNSMTLGLTCSSINRFESGDLYFLQVSQCGFNLVCFAQVEQKRPEHGEDQ